MSEPYTKADAVLTDHVAAVTLVRPSGLGWIAGTLVAALVTAGFLGTLVYLFAVGVGIWGLNIPVAWGFAIASYGWWAGIAMAGIFLSAALLLTGQGWRSGLSRVAETMTVIAIASAGLFPIMHLGRPWFSYWLFPYPNSMAVWPQWRSSLVWDFVALASFVVVALLVWYIALLPDLASLRDRARWRIARLFYGLLCLGWRGEAAHWQRQESATRLLSAFAVPLVFMANAMVALDFSEGLLPGWHSTLFPPFFVADALFSGFALLLVLVLVLRPIYRLETWITDAQVDLLARGLLAASLVVAYSYAMEIFGGHYTGDPDELALLSDRATGLYAPTYWATLILNVALPQLLWWPQLRARPVVLFLVGGGVVIGTWIERFMLQVTTLYHGYLPSADGRYAPTFWDWAILLGSIGAFALLFLLFVRLLPLLPMFDIRRRLYKERGS